MALHTLSLLPVQVAASASASACSNTLGYILSGTSLAQAIIAVRAAAANARVSTAAPPAVTALGCPVPYLVEAWPQQLCKLWCLAYSQRACNAGCCCCSAHGICSAVGGRLAHADPFIGLTWQITSLLGHALTLLHACRQHELIESK